MLKGIVQIVTGNRAYIPASLVRADCRRCDGRGYSLSKCSDRSFCVRTINRWLSDELLAVFLLLYPGGNLGIEIAKNRSLVQEDYLLDVRFD
jgi:hypothetical protein